MKTPSLFTKLRVWIDGDSLADPLEDIARTVQVRKSDNFMVNIANRIDSVLQDELFVPPNDEAQVPPKFVVFLSSIDDQLWRNSKRNVLEKALSEIIYERAIEVCKPASLSVSKIDVCLKVDSDLSQNMFQAIAIWDEAGSEPEKVLRKAEKTMIDPNLYAPHHQNKFYIEVRNKGVLVNEISLNKTLVSIGRGTFSAPVDVPLRNSPQISQIQATLMLDNENKFWLFTQGLNPIFVEGKLYEPNSRILILPLQTIKIGTYELCASLSPIDKSLRTPVLPKKLFKECPTNPIRESTSLQ